MPDLVDSIRPAIHSAIRDAFAQIQPQIVAAGRQIIASPEVTMQLQRTVKQAMEEATPRLTAALDRELQAPATQALVRSAAQEAGRSAAGATWPLFLAAGGAGMLLGILVGRAWGSR